MADSEHEGEAGAPEPSAEGERQPGLARDLTAAAGADRTLAPGSAPPGDPAPLERELREEEEDEG